MAAVGWGRAQLLPSVPRVKKVLEKELLPSVYVYVIHLHVTGPWVTVAFMSPIIYVLSLCFHFLFIYRGAPGTAYCAASVSLNVILSGVEICGHMQRASSASPQLCVSSTRKHILNCCPFIVFADELRDQPIVFPLCNTEYIDTRTVSAGIFLK